MADILESRDGNLVTLTLNRPDSMNSVSDEMMLELLEAFRRLSMDGEVGAIVLTGAGRAFCAGGDIKGMANRGERSYELRVHDLRWKQQIAMAIRTCPKVVVAAVNGPAMGAGLSLALAADFRIVARSAKFGTSFGSIGYSGDFGCSWLLTQLVGPAKARELMILNPRLSAEDADKLGLVTKIVEDEAFQEEVTAFARAIADGPRITWGYMKRNLFAAEYQSLADVLEIEASSQARCAMTEDHKEAAKAWAEKRKPVFTGK